MGSHSPYLQMPPPELLLPQNPNGEADPSTETAGLHAQAVPATNKQQTLVAAITLGVVFHFMSLVRPFSQIGLGSSAAMHYGTQR